MSATSYYVVAAIIVVCLVGALGAGGFAAYRMRAAAVAEADTAPPVATTATTHATGARASAAPHTTATAPATSAAPVASVEPASVELAEVTLKTVPDAVVVIVDGKELPPNTKTFVRPEKGQTVTVVVRALNYEDETLKVGADTAIPAEIVLKPKAVKKGGGSTSGNTALPDNPY
jgi:hypothetical protein